VLPVRAEATPLGSAPDRVGEVHATPPALVLGFRTDKSPSTVPSCANPP
jgi:hypothetical protein